MKVSPSFNPNPRSPFSEVDLNLKAYRTTTDKDDVVQLRLFQFHEDMLPNPDKRPDNFSLFPSILALFREQSASGHPGSFALENRSLHIQCYRFMLSLRSMFSVNNLLDIAFSLFRINWVCIYSQANIHTRMRNVVTLAWGSLRPIPETSIVKIGFKMKTLSENLLVRDFNKQWASKWAPFCRKIGARLTEVSWARSHHITSKSNPLPAEWYSLMHQYILNTHKPVPWRLTVQEQYTQQCTLHVSWVCHSPPQVLNRNKASCKLG